MKRNYDRSGQFSSVAEPQRISLHELPVTPKCPVPPGYPVAPKSPGFPVSPVSNGQEPVEVVRARAAANACKKRGTGSKALFELARDLRAVEARMGGEAEIADLIPFFDEWYRISEPFLEKTRDEYFAELIAALLKVRVPTGQGDTLNKALQAVSKLPESDLPVIPGYPDAPKSWRRIAALHRELSRRMRGNTYFLSCRGAAKASPGLSYQTAGYINCVLERASLIKTVRVGDPRPNGKASEFRYLLPETVNVAEEDDEGFDL